MPHRKLPPFTRSWSVIIYPQYLDAEGEERCAMYAHFKAASMPPLAPLVVPHQMPNEIFTLGENCYHTALALGLTSPCGISHPPNHCELVALYGLLGSQSTPARENYTESDFAEMTQKVRKTRSGSRRGWLAAAEDILERGRGSQVPGSDILIYVVNSSTAPAELQFMNEDGSGDFVGVRLGGGNLYVVKAFDDLCHPTRITIPEGAMSSGHCFAFIFRWLDVATGYRMGSCSPPSSPAGKAAAAY